MDNENVNPKEKTPLQAKTRAFANAPKKMRKIIPLNQAALQNLHC